MLSDTLVASIGVVRPLAEATAMADSRRVGEFV